MDAHHILSQQQLKRHAASIGVDPDVLLWDVRVGVPVTRCRHERHHSWYERIKRNELPPAVFEFAEQYGLTWMLDKDYSEEE